MFFAKLRLFILSIFWQLKVFRSFVIKRLPSHTRGYKYYWVKEDGKKYRLSMYDRQRKGGADPLHTNPNKKELVAVISVYNPKSVLEVGCGYGRLLLELKDHFNVSGIDISRDLLDLCDSSLSVSEVDIVSATDEWLDSNNWDVVFCRAVMMYFLNNESDMRMAMKNMESVANKKVIIWEWPHVCDYMKKVYPSDKFEYQPLALKVE
ncbi:MAG: class I SAM-dependent methyltransferase [Candidatus Vogelbacteria bacterium]|nr:class I SAM-dependent methyltransferase [Candidatus Vogelbacteria bacterium]